MCKEIETGWDERLRDEKRILPVARRAQDGGMPGEVSWRDVPAQSLRTLRPFAAWVHMARLYRKPPSPVAGTRLRAVWREDALLLRFDCLKRYGPRRIWAGGDGVGILLQPDPRRPALRIDVADNGVVRGDLEGAWRVPVMTQNMPFALVMEVALPFALLQVAPPAPGDRWAANVWRMEQPLGEPTAWTVTDKAAPEPSGVWEFGNALRSQPLLAGHLTGPETFEGVVIESAAGIAFPESDGRFAIEGLTEGLQWLRVGGFHYRTVERQVSLGQDWTVLEPIALERFPDEEILARIEQAGGAPALRFETRYEDDPVHRDYQACPSMCVLPDGGLMVTYTCYSGEDVFNSVIVDTSHDLGRTWTQAFVVKQGYYRASWGNLWVDERSRVWMVVQLWRPGHACLHTIRCDAWRPGAQAWGAPRRLCEELPAPDEPIKRSGSLKKGLFPKCINKPVCLRDGTWLLAVESNEWPTRSVYAVEWSELDDRWRIRGEAAIAPEHRQIAEPMIVERRDGSLWMLIRTGYGIAESVSADGGRTWSPFARSPIPHASSRFYLGRLASGRLLLVKHGRMNKAAGREDLTAFLSDDDGQSWPHSLMLKAGACSYPDVDQDAAGRIHAVYDHGRRGAGARILHSMLREDDILAGRVVSPDCRLNQLVALTGPVSGQQ